MRRGLSIGLGLLAFAVGCGDEPPPDATSEALVRQAVLDWHRLQAEGDTEVTAVRVEGERATAVVHTWATLDGVRQATPPASLTLRRDDGRWRMDYAGA